MVSLPFIVALFVIAVPVLVAGYAYVGYPLLLLVVSRVRRRRRNPGAHPSEWPYITIQVPVYNERQQIEAMLEGLLRLDYPEHRRQILILSDASDDGTDEVVSGYASRGVELLRMPERVGKTAAENTARPLVRGEIVVNTDASIRIAPGALKPLLAVFADPTIGVASGRDVSMALGEAQSNVGESGYVGYEMWVRDLETRVEGIVGASGCLYAIRRELQQHTIPDALSRDFASALTARRFGYRAVSVPEAICYVPRVPSLRREYRRKVRTIRRGLQTLLFRKELLNPLRYGIFSWMLFSHKICRWLVPWSAVIGAAGAVALAAIHPVGWWIVGAGLGVMLLALAGWLWPEDRRAPRVLAVLAFFCAGNVAALRAWIHALRGSSEPIWEPTRREVQPSPAKAA